MSASQSNVQDQIHAFLLLIPAVSWLLDIAVAAKGSGGSNDNNDDFSYGVGFFSFAICIRIMGEAFSRVAIKWEHFELPCVTLEMINDLQQRGGEALQCPIYDRLADQPTRQRLFVACVTPLYLLVAMAMDVLSQLLLVALGVFFGVFIIVGRLAKVVLLPLDPLLALLEYFEGAEFNFDDYWVRDHMFLLVWKEKLFFQTQTVPLKYFHSLVAALTGSRWQAMVYWKFVMLKDGATGPRLYATAHVALFALTEQFFGNLGGLLMAASVLRNGGDSNNKLAAASCAFSLISFLYETIFFSLRFRAFRWGNIKGTGLKVGPMAGGAELENGNAAAQPQQQQAQQDGQQQQQQAQQQQQQENGRRTDVPQREEEDEDASIIEVEVA